MKKNLLVAAAIASVGFTAAVPLASTLTAHAATNNTGSSSIVDKISSTFKLNKTDVQKVFDEEHAARQTERTQTIKDKLAADVKAGKITQAQADKITAKIAEMQAVRKANHDSMKDKTQAERKAAMDTKKAELDAWAKNNGIDASYLMMGHGGRGGPEGRGGHMRGDAQ